MSASTRSKSTWSTSTSVSNDDIRTYVNQRSKINHYDERIDAAHRQLDECSTKEWASSQSSSCRRTQSAQRSHSSQPRTFSQSLVLTRSSSPERTHPRPQSANERTRSSRLLVSDPTRKSILKKSRVSKESPEQWFQRIMRVKQLSPVDLCDVFSYGNARKHRKVLLSHICEVLFDLDPRTEEGYDPVTEEMEDFLYQYSNEEHGEIVVNVKDALRALNIWELGVTSQSSSLPPSPCSHLRHFDVADPSPTKSIILESKNKKLQSVIADLQDANLRLSRQLDAATKEATVAVSPTRSNLRDSGNWSSSPPKSRPTSPEVTNSRRVSVVNTHEEELVAIANQLQYTGVRQLEELLLKVDKTSTGFVSLGQLRHLLADHFEVETSETQLMEMCLGMTFNDQAQLSHKEFIHVLLDILIYALPKVKESSRERSLLAIKQYFESGFQPDTAQNRTFLSALCDKYDLEGNECVSITELMRVFYQDLAAHHALQLPFPLTQQEIVQLVQPLMNHNVQESANGHRIGFLRYPALVDLLFGAESADRRNVSQEMIKQALTWEFWLKLRKDLCGDGFTLEPSIHAQICKILNKLDTKRTYQISKHHFIHIFDQHLESDEIDVVIQALRMDQCDDTEDTEARLRYDVLLKMVFGNPDLQDDGFFNRICKKLKFQEVSIRAKAMEIMKSHGGSWRVTLTELHDLLAAGPSSNGLTTVELLYVMGCVDEQHEGYINIKTLWSFLTSRCWKGQSKKEHIKADDEDDMRNINSILKTKELVARCCASYNLERVLAKYRREESHKGWVSQEQMVAELKQMLKVVGMDNDKRGTTIKLRGFMEWLTEIQAKERMNSGARSRDAIRHDSSLSGAIHIDAFFDHLFDWNTLIQHMRLPHNLVEVKKALELFDWKRNGSILLEDWNKAWRQICFRQKDVEEMMEWELHVLQRRFPAKNASMRTENAAIDYARLLVFLLEYQVVQGRDRLKKRMIQHFQKKCSALSSRMSNLEVERFFRALDKDDKAHFNMMDLREYLLAELTFEENDDDRLLLQNTNVMTHMMDFLAGDDLSSNTSGSRTAVITKARFQELVHAFRSPMHDTLSWSENDIHRSKELDLSKRRSKVQVIDSLRALELAILDICSQVCSTHDGQILPSMAFRHLAQLPLFNNNRSRRKNCSRSPTRRSGSPSRSMTTKQPLRELEATSVDPLTPSSLKQMLYTHYQLQVSTHLVSQFFLHIGSSSKYFLDLLAFAKWVAPLTAEMEGKIRQIVKKMIVKGKGGGGKVDLDRFLAQMHRRLLDSPASLSPSWEFQRRRRREDEQDDDDELLRFVRPSLLLMKLQQLNVPISKPDMEILLRHFGMEELEEIDYVLFLYRLYELNTTLTRS